MADELGRRRDAHDRAVDATGFGRDKPILPGPEGYELKIERYSEHVWTGELKGPGIGFPWILSGHSRDDVISRARQRIAWLKNRPEPEIVEL